jgi:hypothetical protein
MMPTIDRDLRPEGRQSQDIGSSLRESPQAEHHVKQRYLVIHPLDDAPEAKLVVTSEMGRIKLTRSVKASLFALRAYLIIMLVLVAYRVIRMVH